MADHQRRLVRTPIVDKNGVMTTRLKKPEKSSSAKALLAPPLLPSDDHIQEQFVSLVFGNQGGWPLKLTQIMHDDDPTTISLANELLTSGSEAARERVHTVLENSLDRMGRAYAEGERTADPLWQHKCRGSWSPDIKQSMIAAWHIAGIVEETGTRTNSIDLEGRVIRYDNYMHIEDLRGDPSAKSEDRSAKKEYWRGLAILAIINPTLKTQSDDMMTFAAWSSVQPDPRRIINMVRERDTLNVRTLSEVIKEQDQNASSLREGAL